ncbi:MAG: sensor histidine kinase [Methylobacteriaceae bacterium]|nr:sensor histidine kinase [Methylobacteriaceae bacterium]
MPFTRFRSIRTRIAAIALAAAAPMAVIIGANSVLTTSTVRGALESVPEATATALRQSLQTLFVGAARVALTTAEAVRATPGAACEAFLSRVLAVNGGYAALRVDRRDSACSAVRDADRPQTPAIAALFNAAGALTPTTAPPSFRGQVLITAMAKDGLRTVLVRATAGEGADAVTGSVLIGSDLLLRAVAAVDDRAPGQIALVDSAGQPIVLADAAHDGWLPDRPLGRDAAPLTRTLRSRDGVERRFAVHALAAENMYVVAAMDNKAARDLNWQVAVGLIVPLLTLLLIAVAYAHTMRTAFVDWIDRLEAAARRSATDPDARAPQSVRMPVELASVAAAFNDMLEKRQARESALSAAVAHNQYLARELHHRVKNSLQMVQSYLSLGQRAATPEARAALVGAQARTFILAAAYRRALDQNEIVAFDLDAFLQEVADYAASVMRRDDQTVECVFATCQQAGIDEAIPLGMIVAELLEAGLAPADNRNLHLSFTRDGATTLMQAKVDGRMAPPGRLLNGLLRQIGATERERAPDVFAASFTPAPVVASALLRRA